MLYSLYILLINMTDQCVMLELLAPRLLYFYNVNSNEYIFNKIQVYLFIGMIH